ncbi:MAG: CZB domain-containing protein, partial [Magnetococcus sp. WYHC-3]
MRWSHLPLAIKISAGIGLVLVLLMALGWQSFSGITQIVDNGVEVISGNKLRGNILKREVDHLNWGGQVGAFINDANITELEVQLDPSRCAFGQWYYGEGRREAERLVPALAPLLQRVEAPHSALHASAGEIKKVMRRADPHLPGFLAQKEADHLAWSENVLGAIVSQQTRLGVELNPRQCGFGKFLYGDTGRSMAAGDAELARLLSAVEPVHARLHQLGSQVGEALARGDTAAAAALYRDSVTPTLKETRELLHAMQQRAQDNLKGKQQAELIFARQTQQHLGELQELFHSMNDAVEKGVMTEDTMIERAVSTRESVATWALFALVLGVLSAWIITRSITRP